VKRKRRDNGAEVVICKEEDVITPPPRPTTPKPFKGLEYLPIKKIPTLPPIPYKERTYSYGRVTYSPYTYRHIDGTPGTYSYKTTTTGTTTTTPKYFDKEPVNRINYKY
jgi:hypothetical protein